MRGVDRKEIDIIVKISCDRERKNWRWYEADRIQSFSQSFEKWAEELGTNEAGELLIDHGVGGDIHEDLILSVDSPEPKHEIALITFESKDGTPNNIFTDHPAYLFNDDGATIDKLN